MARILITAFLALALAGCTRPNLEHTGGGYEAGPRVTGETSPAPGDHPAEKDH